MTSRSWQQAPKAFTPTVFLLDDCLSNLQAGRASWSQVSAGNASRDDDLVAEADPYSELDNDADDNYVHNRPLRSLSGKLALEDTPCAARSMNARAADLTPDDRAARALERLRLDLVEWEAEGGNQAALSEREAFAQHLTERYMCRELDVLPASQLVRRARKEASLLLEAVCAASVNALHISSGRKHQGLQSSEAHATADRVALRPAARARVTDGIPQAGGMRKQEHGEQEHHHTPPQGAAGTASDGVTQWRCTVCGKRNGCGAAACAVCGRHPPLSAGDRRPEGSAALDTGQRAASHEDSSSSLQAIVRYASRTERDAQALTGLSSEIRGLLSTLNRRGGRLSI
ncbi:hypothetical protein JKP88DRAFT_305908 [Tribonema minus]|uniref:RanBP2-type domain-containing protein n=1 Tax=Tribonema minus TaxID=303371 RepID=A0A835Z8K7_9STRA|nr:hypothetical protein JKP88DRAFT_305908 [Tribonema minus]